MGAEYRSKTFDGSLTEKKLQKEYRKMVEQDKYERGHGASQGTFPDGLTILKKVFTNESEAWEWLENQIERGENALGVLVKQPRGNKWIVAAKVPT